MFAKFRKLNISLLSGWFILLFFVWAGASCSWAVTVWHDWDEVNLNNITVSGGSYQFVTSPLFEADHSIQFDYSQSGSITFPYRYDGESMYDGYCLITILNLSADSSDDIFTIEFIKSGVVEATGTMKTYLPGWNRFELKTILYGDAKPINGLSLTGSIPGNPDSIRITAPAGKSDTVYIGKVFLGTRDRWNAVGLNLAYDRLAYPPVSGHAVPPLPVGVTQQQMDDMSLITTRMEELNDVADYRQVASLDSPTMDDLTTRYLAYDIQWNNGQVSGKNPMLYIGSADYNSDEGKFTEVMYDVAVSYRNTQSAAEKATLEAMFFDLYDFGMYIGGIPDAWAAGKPFMPAVFLMRDRLGQTGRLTDVYLDEFRRRLGYDRIFMQQWPYYLAKKEGRPLREGESGEDVDYMRIVSQGIIMLALMAETPQHQVRDISEVSRYYSDHAFAYSPGRSDGFKEDGLLYHHWGWLDQYGVDGLRHAPQFVYAFANTEFAISAAAHQRLYDQLTSLEMRSIKSIIPQSLTQKNRSPITYGGNAQESPTKYGLMAVAGSPDGIDAIDDYMARTFLRTLSDMDMSSAINPTLLDLSLKSYLLGLGYRANGERTGHKTYSHGCTAVHKRSNWLAHVKGLSKWQYMRESSDPWVTFMGYGMLDINFNNHWDRYGAAKITTDLASNGYDYRNYPGTTSVLFSDVQNMVNQEYKRYWSDQQFVGGVTQDDNGAFVLRIHGSANNGLDSHYSDKSWFFFDDTIIALGTNITNSIAETTATTIFQDRINDSSSTATYYNSTAPLYGLGHTVDQTLTNSVWMLDSRSVGYWIPAGAKLFHERRSQTNRNWDNNADVTGDFAIAWLDHGQQPSNANHYYITKIGVTPTEMSLFDAEMDGANPPFEILKQTNQVHAVRANTQDTYAGIVFDSALDINVEQIIRVSRPCTFMVKKLNSSQIKLTVSDPDIDYEDHDVYSDSLWWGMSQPHTVQVTVDGQWELALGSESVSVRIEGSTTIITFLVRDGLSFDVTLSDSDLFINLADFAVLASNWLNMNCGECFGADYSGDGNVDIHDMRRLAQRWLYVPAAEPVVYTETFNNMTLDGWGRETYTGDNGFVWNIDAKGVTGYIDASKCIYMPTGSAVGAMSEMILGGIKSFSVECRNLWDEGIERKLELLVNGNAVGFISHLGTDTYTFTVSDIDISGDVTIGIKNATTDGTGNCFIAIDNITWATY